MLDKMIQKKKHELTAGKNDGVIDDFNVEEVL